MPYVKCTFCGHSGIQAQDVGVCVNCIKRGGDRQKIYAIKKYLEKNSGATIRQVSRDLGIKYEDMNRLLEQGSLELIYIKDNENIQIKEDRKIENKRKTISRLRDAFNERQKDYNSDSQLVMDLYNRRTMREPRIKDEEER